MFDGAAVFTALELSDDLQDQQQVSLTTETIEQESRLFETSASRKEIVFIDSGVDDYQTIFNNVDPSFSTYLIDAQQDGFIQMQNILQKQNDVDAIHIIGHASAGQVVLGSAVLNAETLNAQSDNLRVIGSALSNEGDILFYGCNLAQDEKGKLFIQQIGNITQADIAASDDVTGQGGDWQQPVSRSGDGGARDPAGGRVRPGLLPGRAAEGRRRRRLDRVHLVQARPLYRARSRLYRSQILQVNTRWN